ncbi:MAG: RHS repeat-associated core domain-containing protein [Clostridia bacterium]|nr:RHS repeat-associated core domain-containing protein [Clostridia bacterium]
MKKITSLILSIAVFTSCITSFAYNRDTTTKVSAADLLEILESDTTKEKTIESNEEWIEYLNNNTSTDSLVPGVSLNTSDLSSTNSAEINTDTAETEEAKKEEETLSLQATSAVATASTTEEEILLDPVNAPFNIVNYGNENVSLSTGGLIYEHSIISLPGRNGLDLNLMLKYSSDASTSNEAEFEKGRSEAAKNGYFFANGWGFGFDNLLLSKKHKEDSLVLSSGETYELETATLGTTDKDIEIKGYLLTDMKLTGNKSEYTLSFNDGTVEKFDTVSGVILSKSDRFGNTITFEYDTIEYYRGTFTDYFVIPSAYIQDMQVLKTITDSAGRKINFEYETERKKDGIFINSIEITMEESGEDKKLAEIKLATDKNSFGYYTYVDQISEYVNDSEKLTTSFEYEEKTTKIYNSALKTYTLFGECLLLTKINYPTGGYNEYTYTQHQRALKTAHYDVYKVTKSENSEGVINKYEYEGDYSGYPYSYPSGDYNYIDRSSVEYFTTVTRYQNKDCTEGNVTVYRFDCFHDLISETTYELNKASSRYITAGGIAEKTILKDGVYYSATIDYPYLVLYRWTENGEKEFLKPYDARYLNGDATGEVTGLKCIGDDLYVFAYMSNSNHKSMEVYKYNIPENSWTEMDNYGNYDNPMGALEANYNGEVFYFAKRHYSTRELYVYVFNPETDVWRLDTFGYSQLEDYDIYHLGCNEDFAFFGAYNSILQYNFETGETTKKSFSALTNDKLRSGCVFNGKVYCTDFNDCIRIYDIETKTLSDAYDLPYNSATIINAGSDGKIYMFGNKGEIYRFNPENLDYEFVSYRMYPDSDGSVLWTDDHIYFRMEYNSVTDDSNFGGYEKINIQSSDFERKIEENVYNSTSHLLQSKTVKQYKGSELVEDYIEKWQYKSGTKLVTKYTNPEGYINNYTYDSTYYLPTKDVLYYGEDGKITINYTLSAEKDKIISKEEVYDDRQILTEYLYEDSSGEGEELISYIGNVTNETITVTKGTTTEEISNVSYVYDDTHSFVAEKIVENISTNNENFAVADSADVVTEYTYNNLGLLASETDANGNTASYTYNRKGWITSADYPGGKSVDITYKIGENQNKTTMSYNNGDYITLAYYDNLGRVTKESDKGTGKSERILREYTYDGLNLVSTESIGDNLEVYGYDGFGNIIKTISQNAFDTKGVISYNEYDNVKRTVTAITKNLDFDGTDAEETEVSRSVTTYDLMGRTVKVENGFSNGTALETKTFTYDYMGNVLTETDGEGNTTSYAYNDLGQLLTVTDALSGITSYTYDLAGNVASLETPGESVTSYTHDTLGRLISETDALGKTEYYRYDANGNVTGIKDRNLNVITTAYDAANRPVSKAGGSLNVSYSYDAFDNLTEMVDATGTTEFSYTYDNLLESISYPDEKTLFYSYSPEDNTVTKENYREEETVSHFDSLGREVAIYENEDAIAEFVYNGGTIEKAIYENGSTDYSYDNAMRLTGLTSSLTGATGNIGEYSYEYDNRGNQTKKTEIKNGESLVTEYTYDALSRLSSVTEPDGSVTGYSFDANGNISAKSITHPEAFVFTSGDISVSEITSHTVTYTYDANNRLLTETEEVEGDTEFAGTKTYTYDDAGNLIGKTTGGDYGAKAENYVYDAFGRMTEYKVGGETVASYGYNGNGERVSKTVGESLTKFYLENGNVINEGNGTAINVTNYFGATGIFKRVTGDTESILYRNGHGDVVRKTSGTSVLRDYDYDAYGKEKTATADDNPFRYAGEYADEETGLIYLRARYYDPTISRFTAEDTHWTPDNMIYGDKEYKENEIRIPDLEAIMQSNGLYNYCINNPIKYVDTSGEDIIITAGIVGVFKLIGAAVVAIGATYAIKQIVKNIEDNRKHHILHGTNSLHEKGWKKFNIDPNDPNGFEKLLPIINEVVKNGDKSEWTKQSTGVLTRTITYYFSEVGETVQVIINKGLDGIEKITDAFTIFK